MSLVQEIQWAVTGRCNYRCRHCFVGNVTDELPLKVMRLLCERLAEAGVKKVCLTGGEAFLRPDLMDIARYLSSLNINIIQIATNGSLLTEEVLRELEAAGHRPQISISYDGDNGCHDWLRNVSGAEESTFRALDLCHRLGFETASEMTLHTGNLPFLRSSLRKLYEHGCSVIKVLPLLPLGRARLNEGEVTSPDIASLYEVFLDAIAGYYAGEYPLQLRLHGFFASGEYEGVWTAPIVKLPQNADSLNRNLCVSSLLHPFISAGGKLLPCTGMASFEDLEKNAPSLLEMSLEEAMKMPAYRAFCDYTLSRHLEKNETCASCEYVLNCGGGCRLNALAFGGTFSGSDEYSCEFFMNGWREIIPGAIRQGKLEKMLCVRGEGSH